MKSVMFYITKYAVKGIKSLDNWTELEFYKKTFTKDFSIQNYNIKGIYGVNGAGKSGLISSVKILRGLLLKDNYLSNPFVQNQLTSLINKRLGRLEIAVEYLVKSAKVYNLYRYTIIIKKNPVGFYYICEESLAWRKALSHSDTFTSIYSTDTGKLMLDMTSDKYAGILMDKAKNLLTISPLPLIFINNVLPHYVKKKGYSFLMEGLIYLVGFGANLHVYLDRQDVHTDYTFKSILRHTESDEVEDTRESLTGYRELLEGWQFYDLSAETMRIPKMFLPEIEREAGRLYEFLRIFKHDLQSVSLEKREDKDCFHCELILNYVDYSVDAEFESTGVKKLIRLFRYFSVMVQGGIVFIDELDSNLHDVYLCALLEYLMDHAKGQLCFTTHNIGPMDILKRNKKSIDFLSVDHKIYSWTTNGNYSPSTLYRKGMIEGSPFNVDSIDFISAFQSEEDD